MRIINTLPLYNVNMESLEMNLETFFDNENIRERIFEPFFPIKPDKEGAAFGLSVSYFIITENHNDTIEVESAPGEETCFRIILPI